MKQLFKQRLLRHVIASACFTAAGWGLHVFAQEAPAECDALAAEPGAVASVSGVAFEAIDVDSALAACAAALELSPDEPRFSHQYGRALERAGKLQDAQRLYQWASDGGYALSDAALRRLAAGASTPPAGTSPSTQAAIVAERHVALGTALRRYANTLPPDPSDPLPLLAAIGHDPDDLLKWVSDNTRLAAYRGSLRGARGVLLDRAGNSLDRALLLATLLRNAGEEVRLARANLTAEQARALLDATAHVAPVPSLPVVSAEQTRSLLVAAGIDPSRVEDAARAAAHDHERFHALIDQRVATLLPAILDVAKVATDTASPPKIESVAALQDHFWVQLRTAQGWRNLDPHADRLGTALTPAETFDARTAPADSRHSVAIRVIVELQGDGVRREETVLEWTGAPDALIDRPITFSHAPRSMPQIGSWLTSGEFETRVLTALDSETAWTPLLHVGDEIHVDKLFTHDGQILDANLSALAIAGGEVGRIGSEVGALLEGAAGPVESAAAIPTAEWLEVEIKVPGAEPSIERRTVFDLLGPGARAAKARAVPTADALRDRGLRLLGVSWVLVTGATPSAAHFTHIATRDLAAMSDAAHAVALLPPSDVIDNTARVPTLPTTLYTFAIERMHNRSAVLVSPNVVMQHHRLGFSATTGVTESFEIDVVHNGVGEARDPFRSRVEQGVIDTVVEGLVLGDQPGNRNAALLHAEDVAAGRKWVTLDTAPLSTAPADFRARVESDLAAGWVVLVPATAGTASDRLAWWRIDPRTGTTLGMLPNGGGASLLEHALHVYHATHRFLCFVSIGLTLAGHTNAVVGVMMCAAGALAPHVGGALGGMVGGVVSADLGVIVGEAGAWGGMGLGGIIGGGGVIYHIAELLHLAGVGSGEH